MHVFVLCLNYTIVTLRFKDNINTVPQVNQIEINPFHQREDDLQNALSRGNVQLEAWAPFAE